MSRQRFFLIFLLAVLMLAGVRPAAAQAITEIYVDPTRTSANEDGTQTNPYNNENEGRAYLQALPYGGNLYIKRADGTWQGPIPIPPARPGPSGEPLPPLTLYILLGVLGVVLMLAGWWLTRRGRRLAA